MFQDERWVKQNAWILPALGQREDAETVSNFSHWLWDVRLQHWQLWTTVFMTITMTMIKLMNLVKPKKQLALIPWHHRVHQKITRFHIIYYLKAEWILFPADPIHFKLVNLYIISLLIFNWHLLCAFAGQSLLPPPLYGAKRFERRKLRRA